MTKAEVTEYLVTHRGMPREALSVFVSFGDQYRLYSDGIDIHSASQEILANLASGGMAKVRDAVRTGHGAQPVGG